MYIFLDESGSFVNAPNQNAWNVIVAYMMPERDLSRIQSAVADLQVTADARQRGEIKLREIKEEHYFDFLNRLSQLHGILFAVATDAGLNGIGEIEEHREIQAKEIVRHVDLMRHETGRQAVRDLSDRVRKLSPQLFIQLKCQVVLIDTVIRDGILYFVQRFPEELGKFYWRIDQKHSTKTEYEEAFEMLTPPWLQTLSLGNPLIMLKEADYGAFKRFEYPEGKTPTYLKTVYGIDIGSAGGINVGQLLREDLKFVDSKQDHGIQVADLLAAGLRRCLRAQFNDNQQAAQLLGRLMPRAALNGPPIRLLGFSTQEPVVAREIARLIHIMRLWSRAMMSDDWRGRRRP